MRNLSILKYFNSGAPTEGILDDFIPFIELYIKKILEKPEREPQENCERTLMLGILQDLKLFNEEKFKFILRDIYPN